MTLLAGEFIGRFGWPRLALDSGYQDKAQSGDELGELPDTGAGDGSPRIVTKVLTPSLAPVIGYSSVCMEGFLEVAAFLPLTVTGVILIRAFMGRTKP